MTKQSRLALALSSMVLSLGLVAAPAAFAAGTTTTAKHHKTHKVHKASKHHKAHKKAAPKAKAK
ncbi:MAG TPA: hypothetical protein VFR20_00175 [Burkholderiaceae bacterium]|nr:hypothetical protein [Burkholderiaceae bacterium]